MILYESVLSYNIVYECIWKCKALYEPIKRYMKINDRIWV